MSESDLTKQEKVEEMEVEARSASLCEESRKRFRNGLIMRLNPILQKIDPPLANSSPSALSSTNNSGPGLTKRIKVESTEGEDSLAGTSEELRKMTAYSMTKKKTPVEQFDPSSGNDYSSMNNDAPDLTVRIKVENKEEEDSVIGQICPGESCSKSNVESENGSVDDNSSNGRTPQFNFAEVGEKSKIADSSVASEHSPSCKDINQFEFIICSTAIKQEVADDSYDREYPEFDESIAETAGTAKSPSRQHSSPSKSEQSEFHHVITPKNPFMEPGVDESEIGPFSCGLCSACFLVKEDLDEHLLIHSDGSPFFCKHCSAQFTSQGCFCNNFFSSVDKPSNQGPTPFRQMWHFDKRTEIQEKPFCCKYCQAQFSYEANYVKHLYSHTDNPFTCEKCPAQFRTEYNLLSHLRRSHSDDAEPFACAHCLLRFKYKENLLAHLHSHSNEESDSCENSPAHSGSDVNLLEHLGSDSDEETITCEDSSVHCNSEVNFLEHSLSHTDEDRFSCKTCSEQFSSSTSLFWHQCSNSEEEPFSCEHCPARFSHEADLSQHLRSHSDDESFSYENYSARFTCEVNLLENSPTHSVEESFTCEKCSARFSSQANLVQHRRSHSVKESVICKRCSERFSSSTNLFWHQCSSSKK